MSGNKHCSTSNHSTISQPLQLKKPKNVVRIFVIKEFLIQEIDFLYNKRTFYTRKRFLIQEILFLQERVLF